MIKILAFAGSARENSYNKMLVKIAADGASLAGAEVEVLDLRDYPMPLMDEDYEAINGLPPNALIFKEKLKGCSGLLISAPEYNGSITPLLKNVLDWASRANSPGEKTYSAYRDKRAVLMSASPGQMGGMRGLVPLRMLLGNLGVTVIPRHRTVSSAYDAFTEDGSLKDPKLHKAVLNLGKLLVASIER